MPVNGTLNDKIRQTPLPLGKDIFAKIGKSYYVDKTLLIKDIVDSEAEAILFTRPRRFGKTLAMTMLQSYFEIPTDKEQADSKLLEKTLEKSASEAMEQIEKMSYIEELKSAGCSQIFKFGTSFSGKNAKVVSAAVSFCN